MTARLRLAAGSPPGASAADCAGLLVLRHGEEHDREVREALSLYASAGAMAGGGDFLDLYGHLFRSEEIQAVREAREARKQRAAEDAQIAQLNALIARSKRRD